MVNLTDCLAILSISLANNNYHKASFEQKKIIVYQELKNYIIYKIKEIDENIVIDQKYDPSTLITILANYVDISQIIYFIISKMTIEQKHSITWFIDNKYEVIKNNNLIEKILTDNDYVQAFNFIFDYYLNEFKLENVKTLKK